MPIPEEAMPVAANPLSLDNQLCFAVYAAGHAFNRVYRPLLKDLGLTYPQYLVMLVLWQDRQASVGEIGDRLGLDSGTLSPLLKRLEKIGLIRRNRNPDDERMVLIQLTAQGVAAEENARQVAAGIARAVGCSLDEMVRLKRDIDALADRLDASIALAAAS